MKASTKVDISDLEMTMTITMKVSEWRQIMRSLPHIPWSSIELGRLISSTIGSVENAANQTIEVE